MRSIKNVALLKRMKETHRESKDTYGSPRITDVLKQEGQTVSWHRIARLMREKKLKARAATLYYRKTLKLTLKALDQVVQARRPAPGILFHSGRGVEYGAYAYRNRLGDLGMVQSMNRPGRMTDNAFMESFFHSMKSDVIHGRDFFSERHLRDVIRNYMPFYNEKRLHSGLKHLPPSKYEAMIG